MTAMLRCALLAALATAAVPVIAAEQDTSTAGLLRRIELLERANADLERRVRELESLVRSEPTKGRLDPPLDAGPGDQPLYAGINDVTNPVLIEATKVAPEYPEFARKAKVMGKVVLKAVIKKDGSVGDIEVLQAPGPILGYDSGFDEAAIAAVRQWKYKPGLQNGKPVDVYFTVVVTFELN